MIPKIKKLYNSGCENKEFIQMIDEADGDKKPTIFSSDIKKHVFASIYYGWLVGKYGSEWKSHV